MIGILCLILEEAREEEGEEEEEEIVPVMAAGETVGGCRRVARKQERIDNPRLLIP